MSHQLRQGHSKIFWGMKHLNGNILAAVDTETTGLNPEESGIIEIAVLPLNHMLTLHSEFPMFNMTMAPEIDEVIAEEAMRVNKVELAKIILNGNNRDRVADYFIRWFEELNMAPDKKIIPIAHNWPFDRAMIIKWLGLKTFEYIFHYHGRDTMCIGNFLNDVADSRTEKVPFSKLSLKWMCNQYHIEQLQEHSALSDAHSTAQLYRELVKRGPTEYIT